MALVGTPAAAAHLFQPRCETGDLFLQVFECGGLPTVAAVRLISGFLQPVSDRLQPLIEAAHPLRQKQRGVAYAIEMVASANDFFHSIADGTGLHADHRALRGRQACYWRGYRLWFFVEALQRCLDCRWWLCGPCERIEPFFEAADRIANQREGILLFRRGDTCFDLRQPFGDSAQHLAIAFEVRAALFHPFVDA